MQMPNKRDILFLTLRIFSATGGIEKVCRIAGKALNELAREPGGHTVKIFSLYDESSDINSKYFPASIFCGYGKRRVDFLRAVLGEGPNSRMVILSHVNLLVVGIMIKLISPHTKLVLIAHGIEVWQPFPKWKRKMLNKCDLILPVSDFTKRKMIGLYQLPEERFITLNNCLDPFLPAPLQQQKDTGLMERYGIDKKDKVLMSLTRMAFKERYKGYDQVIHTIQLIKDQYPGIKYLIVGKYDALEKERLDAIISDLGLEKHIILAGFIPDEELAAHYNLADLYIMPSRKEGFGIVFIEAMFYGKPVIAGNADGSVDALKNGIFGLLINPADENQIINAITEVFTNTEKYIPKHQEVLSYFSFEVYKENLKKIIA